MVYNGLYVLLFISPKIIKNLALQVIRLDDAWCSPVAHG
jgi:hypothetical protein